MAGIGARLASLTLLLVVLQGAPALADSTVTVNTTDPTSSTGCSLPDAVAYADGTSEPNCSSGTASGTTTIVLPSSDTDYTLDSTLDVTGNTVIQGGGAASTVISGGGAVEVFDIANGYSSPVNAVPSVTISGVTITDGSSGDTSTGCTGLGDTRHCPAESGLDGGGIDNLGALTLQDDVVSDNQTGAGTAPYSAEATPCMGGCAGSSADDGGNGGGIYNDGSLTITGSTITGNNAGAGGNATSGATEAGGGPGESGGSGGTGGSGGGIYNDLFSAMEMTDSTVSSNTAGAGGNAGAGSNATAPGDQGGSAGTAGEGGSGAGIADADSEGGTITGSTISDNTTGGGGNGAMGGTGDGASAGASSSGGDGGSGGGVEDVLDTSAYAGTTLDGTDDTITGNTAAAAGASGAGATPGDDGLGGGIVQGNGALDLLFVTFDDNVGSADGTQLSNPGGQGTIYVSDSIFAVSGGSGLDSCAGGGLSSADNDIDFGEVPQSCPGALLDPKLGPLADNGGPTETVALGSGSGAIGLVPADDCTSPTVDQRGISRPADACDAGAYQATAPSIASPSASASSPTSGSVTASINPEFSSADTDVTVRYGTTSAFGSSTSADDIGAGDTAVAFNATLSGLTPATSYDVEIVATNGDGTTTVSAGTFETPVSSTGGSGSSGGSGGSGGSGSSGGTGPSASIVSASTSGTTLTLKLACAGTGTCSGPIALTADDQTVGSGSFSAAGGSMATEAISLNTTGLRLLAKTGELTVAIALDGGTPATHVTFRYTVIDAAIKARWSASRKSTVVRSLVVSGVPSGASVVVSCHGAGCPFKQRRFTPVRGAVTLTGVFKRHELAVRTAVTVEITAPGEVGEVRVFTVRRHKPPAAVESCLPPGASRLTTCA